jgi:hypothetical protein
MTDKEWSGSPHPDAPDDIWVDDATGQHVCSHCGGRKFTVDADLVHHCDTPGCGGSFFLVDADQIEPEDPFPPEN